MSDISGDKRKRETLEVEQNKRQRLSPELERRGCSDLHRHRQKRQGQPPEAGLDLGGHTTRYPSSQGPVNPEQPLDEIDNVELLELQAAQLQRRLTEARRRASQRGQPARSSGATQPPPGYLPVQSPTVSNGAVDNRLDRYNTSVSEYGHLPKQAPPSINLSTKPKLQGHSSSSSVSQGTWQLVHPSQPPASPNTSAPTRPPITAQGCYPTVSNTGKRDRDVWTASNESLGTKDNRQVQRRKLDTGLPPIPSTPPAGTYDLCQPSKGDQLPSSDGLDLLGLNPSRPFSNVTQQGSGQPVSPINPYDPLSLVRTFNAAGGPTSTIDNIPAPNPWDTAYNPLPNFSQQPQQQPSTESELEAQIRALQQGFASENWAAAGTFAQPINPYQTQQYPNTVHPQTNLDSPKSVAQEQRNSHTGSKKPQTRRQERLQRFAEQGIELGKDNKKKGAVQYDAAGNMFCLLNGKVVPAAYHHERRNVLLARADRLGSYRFPSDHGANDHDRMAYHHSYANYNMKVRNGRPDILYEWEHTKQRPAAQDPGYMHDATDGKVLLDVNNHPIKDWPELPTTISGQVEGMWIEYWRRLNPQISLPDIVARCPKVTQKHASSKEHKLSIAAFGNRMRRHRVLLGTRAWEEREGSREIANRLKELMPNRVLAEIAGQNSTKTWRDLTNDEVDMVLSVNKGQGSAPARAGDKKLEGKKKDERDKAARAKTADIQRRMEAEKRGEDEEYEVVLAQRRADPGIGRSMSVSGYQTQEPAADVPSTLAQDAIGLGHISIESGRSMPAADVWGETSIGMHHQEEDADDSTFVEQPLDGTTLVEAVNPAEVLINSGKPEHDGDVGDETGTPVSVSDIPQAPTEETVDYTLRIPNAMIEFDSVDNSLEITRAEYRNLLRREPPISSRPFESSYQDQWTEIQESFNKKWLRDRPNTIPPLLPKRSGWTGSWDAWAAANVTGTNYDHPGVTISTDTGNSQSGCTGNLEWARALAATFGGLGANDDEFANPSGAPMTSGNPSAMDDLFKDHGAQTIVDPTSAVVDEQETPENCHPATTEEDAPGDLENDFDRFIRESQNVPLNFGEFERGIDDLGCLNDMFNGFAGGSGCLSFSGLENNIGDNSQFPPPAAGDTAPSPFPSEDPQCQATQQAHHPAQPSIAESTISPQCPAPSASQSEDLLTSNGDGQGSLSPPESDAGSQGWETQAWEGEDITNEEIDNLFDSIA